MLARIIRLQVALIFLVAALSPSGGAALASSSQSGTAERPATPARLAQAAVTIDLCAKAGTALMPDSTSVPIWGFAVKPTGIPCTDSSVAAGIPGPVLEATTGDSVTINLTNALSENVSLIFPGMNMLPDTLGAAPGATVTYTFTAGSPGAYLYESGVNTEKQVLMGLYGAFIIRPTAIGQAYDNPNSAFDVEAVLVLSEIDPAINNAISVNPSSYNLLVYAPIYWLINGMAYPQTELINADPGQKVLLRYLNAGLMNHTMALIGAHQRAVGKDAYEITYPYDVVAETLASGQTADMIVTIPTSAASGARFPLYNRQLHVTNGMDFPGGMMTFIEVQSTLPVFGVEIVPNYDEQAGDAGTSLVYTFDVTNLGDTADSYDVTISGNAWPTSAPATIGPLDPGDTTLLTVTVDIPADATSGATDVATITVTSQGDASKSASSTISSMVTVGEPPIVLYFSLANGGPYSVGSVPGVRDEDVLSFDGANFAMFFDGSDVGVGGVDLDAFHVVDADTFLVSFDLAATIGSLGLVDDSDVLQFDATSLGAATAGTFSMFFDGSLVGLTTDGEDVDAVGLLADGRLLISPLVGASVPGLGGTQQDEDVLAFTPSTPGDYSSGTWSVYFDGSDVGLASDGGEDLDGFDQAASGSIALSTLGNFSVSGVSGANEDVFTCASPVTGVTTACAFSPGLLFDGSAFGLTTNNVDAIDVP